MIIRKIDENGITTNRIVVSEDHVLGQDEAPDTFARLLVPKWDGQQWVEGADSDILAREIANAKQELVARIKARAHDLIVAVAPEYQQINWILDGQLGDPDVVQKISDIQAIRQQSNVMEYHAMGLDEYQQILDYVISFS